MLAHFSLSSALADSESESSASTVSRDSCDGSCSDADAPITTLSVCLHAKSHLVMVALLRLCISVPLVALLAAGQSDSDFGSGIDPYPTASAWRVVNAECACNHWNIGELDMIDEEEQSTQALIRYVNYSYHYTGRSCRDGDCVHDGDWFTGGGAQHGTWAGEQEEDGTLLPCGSWLGFTFERPVSVRGVHMAQGEWECQRVRSVSLEAFVDESWQHVTYVHFSSSPENFVGRMDPLIDDRPNVCVATNLAKVCEHPGHDDEQGGFPVFIPVVVVGFFTVLVGAVCFHRRLIRQREQRQPAPPSAVGQGGPPQQQLMPVPMQQPAVNVNVATAVPMQQPMQQPMMVPVMVSCPLGLKPGDMLPVQSPNGQMMQVQVPPGVMPGGQFAVQMPAAPTVAMAAPVQAVDTSGVAMPMPA